MRVVGLRGGWAPGSTVAGIRGPPALGQVFTLLQAVGWLTWAGPAWGQEETGGEPWVGAGRGPRRTRQPCAQRPHSPRGGRWRPRGREHGHATLLRTRPVPGFPWRGLPPRPAPAAAFARLPGLQAPSPSGCTSFLETTQVASPLFPVTSGHALVGAPCQETGHSSSKASLCLGGAWGRKVGVTGWGWGLGGALGLRKHWICRGRERPPVHTYGLVPGLAGLPSCQAAPSLARVCVRGPTGQSRRGAQGQSCCADAWPEVCEGTGHGGPREGRRQAQPRCSWRLRPA